MDDHGWSVYGFPGVRCLRICLGLRELGPETMTSSDRMPAPPGCGGGVKPMVKCLENHGQEMA